MNLGYGFGFLSNALFGIADVFGGIAARRSPAIPVALLASVAAIAVLVVATPFLHGTPATTDLLWGAAAGTFSTAGSVLIYKALALGPMSLASPVLCIVGLSVPVIVGVTLGERPSPLAWTGVALAVLAIPALSITTHHPDLPGRAHVRRTLLVSIAAGLAAGGFLSCVPRIGHDAGMMPLIVARLVAITLLSAVLLARRQPLLPVASARALASGAGACDSAANAAYWIATHTAPMALIASLVSLAPAVTVVLARLFLHERWSGWQKIGLLLALAAGVLITRG